MKTVKCLSSIADIEHGKMNNKIKRLIPVYQNLLMKITGNSININLS